MSSPLDFTVTDLICTELSCLPAISSPLPKDHRRLQIFLQQEECFMPSYHRQHAVGRVVADEEGTRTRMLETMFEALCPGGQPSRSDVYHLAVNLIDRYLSFESIKSEKDFYATSAACAMISLKIRRAREECLSYDHLRYHFGSVSESRIQDKEKEITTKLKWNLNAVTTADFIEELSQRLVMHFDPRMLGKLVNHSLTLANVSLLNHQFMKVPPSLLASACLCDAVKHLAPQSYSKCVQDLATLAHLEQDVLLQHQESVGYTVALKLQSLENQSTNTPADLEEIESEEFDAKFNHSETENSQEDFEQFPVSS